MAVEHPTLTRFRNKWVGKRISYVVERPLRHDGPKKFRVEGVVDGVGDNGALSDHIDGHQAKPTGLLFVMRDSGESDEVLDFDCEILK